MKYRFLMYGEPTSQLNMRVPESKKAEIQKKFEEILKTYENPKRFEITSGDEKSKEVKKVEKPPKKIEPQVVEEELDDYGDFIEKLPSLPFGCKVTGHNEKGHDIYTDIEKKFFYVKEKEGDRYIAVKFENIVQAISYVREYLFEKK
jgi:hypothetical protein